MDFLGTFIAFICVFFHPKILPIIPIAPDWKILILESSSEKTAKCLPRVSKAIEVGAHSRLWIERDFVAERKS